MRIRNFCKLIEIEHLQEYTLDNRTVVIDGQNYFYRLYQESGLQFVFGCECNRFASYLRKHLAVFKKANVQCYFLFKGGHENIEKLLKKPNRGRDFVVGQEYDDIVAPIFSRSVYKEVLDEMNFSYTICEFESKKEIIALAQHLDCPIISYDIEYVFFGHPYIPYDSLKFDEQSNSLACGIFLLDPFLQSYGLGKETLATFAALTDENNFPENHFLPFIKTLKIPLGFYKRNVGILKWLGRTSRDIAVNEILKHSNSDDKALFLEVEKQVYDQILRKEKPGIPSQYLTNECNIYITEKDPLWFEKGVASKHVPIPLINIRCGHLLGSPAIADKEADDPQMLSIDIIKYTFNLLTNFEKQELIFHFNGNTIAIPTSDSVHKPEFFEAYSVGPFENGWDRLPKGLFEYFLCEDLDGFEPGELQKLTEDIRLLMIALIYFSKTKHADVSSEVIGVLLSYIALSPLSDADNKLQATDIAMKDKLDPKSITDEDKRIARSILKKYFTKVSMEEAKKIFKPEWIHLLVEFQHCLNILNNLNTLCGRPYLPTLFHKTIDATFIYKVVYAIKDFELTFKELGGTGNGIDFVKDILNPAATVLTFLLALYQFLEDML